MKKTAILTSILLIAPLLASCHGVYVDAQYAETVYENLENVYNSGEVVAQTQFTYSAEEVNGDTHYEYYSIYSKTSNFYYHYRIGKTWDINNSIWLYNIHETWRYVSNNDSGVATIYRIERFSGTNYPATGGCYDIYSSPYTDTDWAINENDIYTTVSDFVKKNALPTMKKYIDMALSGENTSSIYFASANMNSLYVEAEEPKEDGSNYTPNAKVAIDDNLLSIFEYHTSDLIYSTFECDFEKAVVTYPDLSSNPCKA